MLLLGLTGSIGTGKSYTLKALRRLTRGFAFYDADAAVHALYRRPDIIAAVKKAFPTVVSGAGIDRQKLGEVVLHDSAARQQLQRIVYPALSVVEKKILETAARRRAKIAVLDIPLLFETGAQNRLDVVLSVFSPAFLQKQRVLRRPGMTEKRLTGLLNAQLSQHYKIQNADFTISSGLGRAESTRRLQKLLQQLTVQNRRGHAWRGLYYLKEFYARNRA